MSQHYQDGAALGVGPSDSIAAMQQATRGRTESRPSPGLRSAAPGSATPVNKDFVGAGTFVDFTYTPDKRQLGYLNPITTRPAPPLHRGLIIRVLVSQRFLGWDAIPKDDPGYTIQPIDGFSNKVSGGLNEAAGQHFAVTNIPKTDAPYT